MRKVRVALGEESYDILIGYGLEKELQSFVQGGLLEAGHARDGQQRRVALR